MSIAALLAYQVFPNEYRKALRNARAKQLAEEKAKMEVEPLVNGLPNGTAYNGELTNGVNGNHVREEPKVIDIESTIPDVEQQQKTIERVLDKTRWDLQ